MAYISDFLKNEVPEINFTVAHGQLSGSNLDNVIADFISNKTDLLLSTSIVESGLDFPNANTLIVHRANMFGLSQLYQIRGRVGRSKIRAYCYLTYEQRNKMTKQGEKRLKILANINSLGQGFSLASQDLDIRGAGNLLGEEQSGEIREVGYELYQSMLKKEIDSIKDKQTTISQEINDFIPQIDLNVPMLIPENYVKDLVSRLSLYRELALLKTDAELNEFSERIIDRFGSFPSEVDILIKVSSIKNLCVSTGINMLKVGQNRILVGFHENKFSNPTKLMEFIQKNNSFIKVKEDKIVITKIFENNNKKLDFIKMLVKNFNTIKKTPS
jgi:transcription-repair coupling factor (superfamily II helicase)